MEIQINITALQIADLMISAIEGNHMTRSWCNGIFIKGVWETIYDDIDAHPDVKLRPWYSNPDIYEADFEILVEEIIDESKPLTPKNIRKHKITEKTLKKGFQIMAEKEGRHFGKFLQNDYDIYTSDVFLQCVALKEVIYG